MILFVNHDEIIALGYEAAGPDYTGTSKLSRELLSVLSRFESEGLCVHVT